MKFIKIRYLSLVFIVLAGVYFLNRHNNRIDSKALAFQFLQDCDRKIVTEKIKDNARKITVKLLAPGQSSSGTIIEKNDKSYKILTTKHSINGLSNNELIDIITWDGRLHKGSVLTKSSFIDLAEVKFNSRKDYLIANTPEDFDSFKDICESSILVSGFPLFENSIKQSVGDIGSISTTPRVREGGYGYAYTAPTFKGMSGGSIVNTQGILIGIHGQTDIYYERSGRSYKTGGNKGIPLKFWLLANQLGGLNKVKTSDFPKPSSIGDLQLAATRAISDRNYEYALELFEEIRIRQGAFWDPVNTVNTAMALNQLGRYEESVKLLQSTIDEVEQIKNYPIENKYDLIFSLALANSYLNNLNKGIEGFTKVIKYVEGQKRLLNENDYKVYMNRGSAYSVSGQLYKAIIDLKKARQINPKIPAIHEILGFCYLSLDKFKEAEDSFNHSLELYPGGINSLKGLGDSKFAQNKNRLALQAYEKALRIKPNYWALLNNKGLVLFEEEKIFQAIKIWETVLKTNQNAETTLALAAALNKLEEGNAKSIELAIKALNQNPNFISAKYQEDKLWGKKLQRAAKELLAEPSLSAEIKKAIENVNLISDLNKTGKTELDQ